MIASISEPEEQPPLGKDVWVHCNGFKCVGVWNANGTWTNPSTGVELPDVLGWQEI